MEPILVISSDGHAVAPMRDYRTYLEARYIEEFDSFLAAWEQFGDLSTSEKALRYRTDDGVVREWREQFLETGRVDGFRDPARRLVELDRCGISGEVLFPDFGTPFAFGSPTLVAVLGKARYPLEYLDAGYRAHNRWLAEYVSVAPERFAAMAALTFDDVPKALAEIRWAHEHGFRGVVLPPVPDDRQLFDTVYDPIWAELVERDMVLNSHILLSADQPLYGTPSNPTVAVAIQGLDAFYAAQRILRVLIWGGVLERHPGLRVVFSEQHSDWVVPVLARMDFSYERGELRKDIRDTVPMRPSDYWRRQCFLGSSIFSRAEIRARHAIGVDKMMLGFDYPHFEGAWRLGHGYLQATLGEAQVPDDEARQLLGGNAVHVFGFDRRQLELIAARIGPSPDVVLSPPAVAFECISADLDRPLLTVCEADDLPV